MSNKLISRSRQIQFVAIAALLGGLHAEQMIDIGTPGKDHCEAFKAGLQDLIRMIKSGKYDSKTLRARFSSVIAQLQLAIAAMQSAQGTTPWSFSDANYASVFAAVQALVAYSRANGISLVEGNPVAKMVQNLNGVLASAMDNAAQGWYEQVLVATQELFTAVQAAINAPALRTTALHFTGFEPAKTAEAETSFQATSAPADKALVAASGETIDSESPQEDYSKVGYNAHQAK